MDGWIAVSGRRLTYFKPHQFNHIDANTDTESQHFTHGIVGEYMKWMRVCWCARAVSNVRDVQLCLLPSGVPRWMRIKKLNWMKKKRTVYFDEEKKEKTMQTHKWRVQCEPNAHTNTFMARLVGVCARDHSRSHRLHEQIHSSTVRHSSHLILFLYNIFSTI